MSILSTVMLAAMTSAQAIATLLNSPNAVGPKVFERAKAQVMEEAYAGKPLQQFVIGVTTKDVKLAKQFLDSSRDRIRDLAEGKDNPLAWYLLSMESNNFEYLRKAADGGNVQALNAIGTIEISRACADKTLSTNEVEKVLCRGFEYFNHAALQHDANALINLGACYLRGFGCHQDMVLAYRCFKAAADAGHPEGMDYVSACYENGHGVPIDNAKALYWRVRGRAARDDENAKQWLRDHR